LAIDKVGQDKEPLPLFVEASIEAYMFADLPADFAQTLTQGEPFALVSDVLALVFQKATDLVYSKATERRHNLHGQAINRNSSDSSRKRLLECFCVGDTIRDDVVENFFPDVTWAPFSMSQRPHVIVDAALVCERPGPYVVISEKFHGPAYGIWVDLKRIYIIAVEHEGQVELRESAPDM
jgi:hypothetical protein